MKGRIEEKSGWEERRESGKMRRREGRDNLLKDVPMDHPGCLRVFGVASTEQLSGQLSLQAMQYFSVGCAAVDHQANNIVKGRDLIGSTKPWNQQKDHRVLCFLLKTMTTCVCVRLRVWHVCYFFTGFLYTFMFLANKTQNYV